MNQTHYVVLGHDVAKDGRMSAVVGVSGLPEGGVTELVDALTLYVYEVTHCRKPNAIATVMKWLATGQPQAMTVRTVYSRDKESS